MLSHKKDSSKQLRERILNVTLVCVGEEGFDMEYYDDSEDFSDYYECVLTPNNAPEDSKTGITFKGKDSEYLKAHKMIIDIAKNKGDSYNINGIEVNIADAPKNKPACVEIKAKSGQTGKANLKIYAINGRGYGTIHLTKVSKADFEYVKILAFKVVKYLLDGIIAGGLQNEDLHKMKKKFGSKKGRTKYNHDCKSCGRKFKTVKDLTVHVKIDHTGKKVEFINCDKKCGTCEDLKEHHQEEHKEHHKLKNQGEKNVDCNLCDKMDQGKEDLEKHKQTSHEDSCVPNSKRVKTNIEDYSHDEEKMEVDDPYIERSRMQDEKVNLIQKRFDEEQEKQNELKRKKSVNEDEKNIKKKKLSVKKKKSKKKNKRDKHEENSDGLELKEIPVEYDEVFKESGKNRKEFGIFSVKSDGACGANSTALHCHRDQNLGPYVMRNVNDFTVKFWPFFKQYFQFPIEVKIGSKTKNFDEKSFLEFLRTDPSSGYMWMEHQGWQVVANMYKININILTLLPTGVKRARWTYIVPDERLSSFSKVHKGLPDMWIMHVDETHYDLMVHKESDLAKEGTLEDLAKKEEERSEKVLDREDIGPGYMGWEANDEMENKIDEMDTNKSVVQLIEWYSELKKEVSNLKQEIKRKERKQETEQKMLEKEFVKCLESLKAETYARTKAETLAKVLQDTLDAKNEMEKLDQTQEMEVDVKGDENEQGGKWEKQRSERRRERKRNRNSVLCCKECEKTFRNNASLKKHEFEHEQQDQFSTCEKSNENLSSKKNVDDHVAKHKDKRLNCNECDETFTADNELIDHVKNHVRKGAFECQKCEIFVHSKEELTSHIESHVKQSSNMVHVCIKCDKKYSDMRKLRRHDWRMHRPIECSICEEVLTCRQELKDHRQNVHKMRRKIPCRFFPDCYDEDECLFEHTNIIEESSSKLCQNGQHCTNQECLFTEKQHKMTNKTICKFQELCNRAGCQFKHIVQRKAFLEIGPSKKGQA